MKKAGFFFDHVLLTPDKQIELHTQDTWELTYVKLGAGTRTVGAVTSSFVSGDLLLVPPEIPHCWTFSPEITDEMGRTENITLMFPSMFVRKVAEALPSLSEPLSRLLQQNDAAVIVGERARRISRRMIQMCEESAADRAVSMVSILSWLAESERQAIGHFRQSDSVWKRLSDIRIYVSCNYMRPLSLDEIAHHVGMNRSAFCLFFRKHTGKTFVAYLNEYRVEVACKLLQKGSYSVAEVCWASGFNDPAYFSRIFSKLKRCSPLAYKNGCRPE